MADVEAWEGSWRCAPNMWMRHYTDTVGWKGITQSKSLMISKRAGFPEVRCHIIII